MTDDVTRRDIEQRRIGAYAAFAATGCADGEATERAARLFPFQNVRRLKVVRQDPTKGAGWWLARIGREFRSTPAKTAEEARRKFLDGVYITPYAYVHHLPLPDGIEEVEE